MSKLSALISNEEIDEITTPAEDQVVHVVEDPEGTPVDKYMDLGKILAGKAGLLTAADAPTEDDTLTFHEETGQTVSSGSYQTILDLTGAYELITAFIAGHGAGYRLTIDGEVVINNTTLIWGEDDREDNFFVASVPPARSATSLKLEAYNTTGTSRVLGWQAITREA